MFCAAAFAAGRLALPGPDAPEGEQHEDAPADTPSYRCALLIVAALSVVALSGTFVEDAGSTWSALFLRDIVGATGGIVGLGYVSMVAAQFVGRITGDRFTDRYGARAVTRVGAVLIATGMTLMLLWPSTATTLGAFALAGFGCATLVPAAFDVADRIPGLPEGTGLTMIGWTMRLAFLSGPPLVGLITDAVGLRIGLAIVSLGAIALVFASRVLPARTAPRDFSSPRAA